MDRHLKAMERIFKANPIFENFRAWFRASRRAGIPVALDSAREFNFSAVEDSLEDFRLFNTPLADIYLRTQLACSNILAAAVENDIIIPRNISQAVNKNFASMIWLSQGLEVMERRWFWCPLRSSFIYYFDLAPRLAKGLDTNIPLVIKVPYIYGSEVPVMRIPFEKCDCGRQTFLVELVEDAQLTLQAYLDCFNESYAVVAEHDMTFSDFSLGHQFNLLEDLERLHGTPITHIEPPENSIELPT